MVCQLLQITGWLEASVAECPSNIAQSEYARQLFGANRLAGKESLGLVAAMGRQEGKLSVVLYSFGSH